MIPTYRRLNDLTRCLDAIKRQTMPPYEIIVITRNDDTETLNYLKSFSAGDNQTKTVTIHIPGVVQAMNKGLAEVSGDIVAITDDDSEPHSDWLERMDRYFAEDPKIGGVGGRDWICENGRFIDKGAEVVGKLQWFGRMIGNHHLGIGPAREVDFLKGVNCAYRTELLKKRGFDVRLLGTGAQVHWELSIGLALKKTGWKLVYDPAIAVRHFPAQRFDEDKRNEFNPQALRNAVHNETLIIMEHISFFRKLGFFLWAGLIGTSHSPGLIRLLILLLKPGRHSLLKYYHSLSGRLMGIDSWRKYVKKARTNLYEAASFSKMRGD
ncbi:glycosyltransferase family 2 protein [Paenibacillus hamazuiensis]|uniref:glycosyltransferase family 2 protein n=1 Tax=Paenibacillus hamazuiensis TaxID=2936508 RepID=UPI00200E0B61|nr:glycosyltransferase family A protein [Paenibacillus hamazuiensis]